MNHVNVEEVEEQPDAVIGMFLVKSFTAIVIFYTGASHSDISRGLVSSPGAEYMASQGCF